MLLCERAKQWMLANLTGTPWHGLRCMPTKRNGLPYVGINIPVLLMQMQDIAPLTNDGRFGSYKQFDELMTPIKKGQKSLHAIYAGSRKIKKKEGDDKPSDAQNDDDDEPGMIRFFNAIPIFHASQTENWELAQVTRDTKFKLDQQRVDVDAMREFAGKARELAIEKVDEFNDRQKKADNQIKGADTLLIERLAADLVIAHQSGLGLEYAGILNGAFSEECLSRVACFTGGKIMRPWGIASAVLRACAPGLDAQMAEAEAEAARVREAYEAKRKEEAAIIWF